MQSSVILSGTTLWLYSDLLRIPPFCLIKAFCQEPSNLHSHHLHILFRLTGQHPVCEHWFASLHPGAEDSWDTTNNKLKTSFSEEHCKWCLSVQKPPPQCFGFVGGCPGIAMRLRRCSKLYRVAIWFLWFSGWLLIGQSQKSPPTSLYDILIPRYGSVPSIKCRILPVLYTTRQKKRYKPHDLRYH